ncbi:MAG: FtsX-like permease family protein, partial [Flavitalea sp.]
RVASVPSLKQISFIGYAQSMNLKIENESKFALHEIVDEYYLDVMQIPLKRGRKLDPVNYPSDVSGSILVNEAFVAENNLKEPIGKVITLDKYFQDSIPKTIVGVVGNVQHGSMRDRLKPAVMFMQYGVNGGILLKINAAGLQEGLKKFEEIYHELLPEAVYSYAFMDDINKRHYEDDLRWKTIFGAGSGISILICCLGLFGLVYIAGQQRTREIGIRKVIGASNMGIVKMISLDFVKLVVIAFVIATPIALIAVDEWLSNFAFRIQPGIKLFGTAILITALMVIASTMVLAMRIARANPVKALRQ